MRKYSFTATTVSNRKVKGTTKAKNYEQVRRKLTSRYVAVQSIVDKGDAESKFKKKMKTVPVVGPMFESKFVDPTAFCEFLSRFAMLNEAGVSTQVSLERLTEYGEDKSVIIPDKLLMHIKQGKTLPEAFQAEAKFFKKDYSSLINAGFESGTLPKTMRRLSEEIEADVKLTKTINSATSYPKMLLCFAIVASFAIFRFILPSLLGMMGDIMSGELPALTQVMMKIMDWFEVYGVPVFLGAAAAVFALLKVINKFFAFQRDTILLNIPVLGLVLRNRDIIRLFRSLGALDEAKVAASTSLGISYKSVQNLYLKKQLEECYKKLKFEGCSLVTALGYCTYIDEIDIQLLQIGVDSGNLAEMLLKRADTITEDNELLVKQLSSMIEPIAMLLIGGLVMIVVVSVYLPMFSMMGSTMG